MLAEVRKFHRVATALLDDELAGDGEPLGAFVERHGFSEYFVEHFMTPLVAAVWSCAPGEAMRYPARYLFVFLQHHGMLSVFGSPTWRTVVDGSATYVRAIADQVDEVATGMPVRSVRRLADGVRSPRAMAHRRRFDAAVIATHPDQALAALADPTPGRASRARRHALLDQPRSIAHRHFGPAPQTACPRFVELPVTPEADNVLVTYDISRLMRLSGPRRYLVTLGGKELVDPATVIAEMTYAHPIYTPESVAAQRRLPALDDDRVVFAGAYHGWGFHEDGAASGLRAARRLGADWPAGARLEAVRA